jgi:hypothetical protein
MLADFGFRARHITTGRKIISSAKQRFVILPSQRKDLNVSKSIRRIIFAGIASFAFCSASLAQSTQQAGTAKPAAASAPAPVHDLSGVWNMRAAPAQRRVINYTFTADPPELTPWAAEKHQNAKPSNGPRSHRLEDTDDPILKDCLPTGTPRIYLQPAPMEILQTPKEIIILYEHDHTVRQVFMDGRAHPADVIPTYMGHSIGSWEGDTLVVDTVGFNDKTWLDRDGRPHSDQLHVIERFHRVDRDNMTIDLTMEDPKALLKPWKVQLYFQYKPDWVLMEQDCTDNSSFAGFEK